jgi:ATP-dependent helicase/nuclease subunit B
MSRQLLLTGPDFSALESRTFEELADHVGTHPGSILYLTQQDHSQDATRDRWREFGSSATLRIDTFDGLVSDWYERDQYKGRVTNIDQPLLSRLVELGVEDIESPTNPLHTGDRFPRAGLVQEAKTLFTELEFAGLLSPDTMQTRLEKEDLASHANYVMELAEAIETARTKILSDTLRETYRSERMHHATRAASLADVFPSVEAVVLSGFTRFDVLEFDLLQRISDTWPIVALLPLQNDTDATIGIDVGTERALEAYLDLGFSREFHDDTNSKSTEARRQITRSLYRHPEQSPPINDIDVTALDLTVIEPNTVPDEIRYVARDIRRRLAADIQAEDIGVLLTDPVQYADQIREVFETYELPFSLNAERPLPETALGDVVQTICQLAREPRTIDSLQHLLTNPLVDVTHDDGQLDHRHLTRVAARAETNRLDSTLEYVDEAVAAPIDSLLREIATLTDVSLDTLPDALDALLERLGVHAALTGELDISRRRRTRERSARDNLDRILETLELTEPMADPAVGDSVDRLERALQDVSIQPPSPPADQRIVICDLADALSRDFEHVYVLGLTSTHFPSNAEPTAFTQPIYEAHPDFEQTDVAAEARYHFGALFGSETSIRLSVPQRSVSGEPYVEADILTELRRFVDLSAIEIDPSAVEPGCQEDVQWSIGEASEEQARDLVAQAVDTNTFTTAQQSHITAGVTCAAARASPELTPYDGQLTNETVASVHDTLEREPYSPSRLETYAACGFKYYMQHVLGIEAPEPLTREPDAGTRGSYVHDVLEHYYLSLQTVDGEPVHPGGDFEARQELLLDVALDRLDKVFDDYSRTAFQQEWLTMILGGLGTPETNQYYGPDEMRDGRPVMRGLFYRFLEHEFDKPAKTTARPTWFEGRIGNPYDAGTPLGDDPARIETPQGTVPIHGLIDRVETVPDTEPTQVVIRDYKTGGNLPSESDALAGLKFQLPLYALMAEDTLDNIEVVGGAYYQVSPPRSITSRSGLLTSQDMAVYHGSDEIDTPLLRHTNPHFETHEAFRRFIEETTPQRLGDLASGITEGQFHPTILDPSDAGCRYCDYAHVCDVRSHQRREVIESIDDAGDSVYIPPLARDQDLETIVGVE